MVTSLTRCHGNLAAFLETVTGVRQGAMSTNLLGTHDCRMLFWPSEHSPVCLVHAGAGLRKTREVVTVTSCEVLLTLVSLTETRESYGSSPIRCHGSP